MVHKLSGKRTEHSESFCFEKLKNKLLERYETSSIIFVFTVLVWRLLRLSLLYCTLSTQRSARYWPKFLFFTTAAISSATGGRAG